MKLILMVVLLGKLTVTTYRSVPEQTDNTPFITATGEHVSESGAAISQDLLCGACKKLNKRCQHPEYDKKIHYGDTLYIENVGMRIVNDSMGKYSHTLVQTKQGKKRIRHKQLNWIDVWVRTYNDEHWFHTKYGITKHQVWKIQGQLQ